jgi:hypothetical protein
MAKKKVGTRNTCPEYYVVLGETGLVNRTGITERKTRAMPLPDSTTLGSTRRFASIGLFTHPCATALFWARRRAQPLRILWQSALPDQSLSVSSHLSPHQPQRVSSNDARCSALGSPSVLGSRSRAMHLQLSMQSMRGQEQVRITTLTARQSRRAGPLPALCRAGTTKHKKPDAEKHGSSRLVRKFIRRELWRWPFR